jgi:hypothetical protein
VSTLSLAFVTAADRDIAADILAQLARQCVTFTATTTRDGLELVVTFIGRS